MGAGTIHDLIDILDQAFKKLSADVSASELEALAVDVHRALSVETRRFHTLEHVIALTDPNAPIRSLAAVFHDLVYYQVDQGFPSSVSAIIMPYLLETDEGTFLVEADAPEDRAFKLLHDLFAISPGQVISRIAGINEFLSALVTWKKLESILPEAVLLKIATHIEATIPFRGQDGRGRGHFDVLATRIKDLSLNFSIPLSDAEVDETIQSAVAFANQDVAGFAHPDPAIFLDNTWKLLPEENAGLRSERIYAIREYRRALQKMEAFFAWLNPQNIFHCYKGVPTKQKIQEMTVAAHQNIETARAYLGVKLLAIAIIEGLADITGGDTPLALFMGDIQTDGETQQRLENYLPKISTPTATRLDPPVYKLLAEGRPSQSRFDLQNAPLALYLYQYFGNDGCAELIPVAQEMFAGNRTAAGFLAAIEPSVISTIALACAEMVPTRRDLLHQFMSAT